MHASLGRPTVPPPLPHPSNCLWVKDGMAPMAKCYQEQHLVQLGLSVHSEVTDSIIKKVRRDRWCEVRKLLFIWSKNLIFKIIFTMQSIDIEAIILQYLFCRQTECRSRLE